MEEEEAVTGAVGRGATSAEETAPRRETKVGVWATDWEEGVFEGRRVASLEGAGTGRGMPGAATARTRSSR